MRCGGWFHHVFVWSQMPSSLKDTQLHYEHYGSLGRCTQEHLPWESKWMLGLAVTSVMITKTVVRDRVLWLELHRKRHACIKVWSSQSLKAALQKDIFCGHRTDITENQTWNLTAQVKLQPQLECLYQLVVHVKIRALIREEWYLKTNGDTESDQDESHNLESTRHQLSLIRKSPALWVSEMSLPLLKNTEELSLGAKVLEGNAPSLQDPPKLPATASSDIMNS